ncbi:MAG TPA: MBL fold metallo-hydrolase [Actinomycetota bacterium]|nr:MBL fold metallo-hydrolase [Actinomycetota bacterium]
MSARAGETPHPPATAEFGHVKPGGPTHAYEVAGGVAVKKLSVGPFDNNVYVVRDAASNDALIVDGAADAERILREVEDLRVLGIVETHGHPDHVQALPDLVAALKVPVYAHAGDAARMPVETQALRDGQTIVVGGAEIGVMHTPGHTPGSISLIAGPFLFSGDTLFPAGPGGTDGNAARFTQLMQSLDRLFELPDETRICPGHGLDSTIGRERPYLETWRARGW